MDDPVIDYIADIGWDPEYGARPIRRAILKELQNPLAKKLLEVTTSAAPNFRSAWQKTGQGLEFNAQQ